MKEFLDALFCLFSSSSFSFSFWFFNISIICLFLLRSFTLAADYANHSTSVLWTVLSSHSLVVGFFFNIQKEKRKKTSLPGMSIVFYLQFTSDQMKRGSRSEMFDLEGVEKYEMPFRFDALCL